MKIGWPENEHERRQPPNGCAAYTHGQSLDDRERDQKDYDIGKLWNPAVDSKQPEKKTEKKRITRGQKAKSEPEDPYC